MSESSRDIDSEIDDGTGHDMSSFRDNVPRSSKNPVRALDPNDGRCLIENTPTILVVQFTHCVPKQEARRLDLMANLEWWWNMDRRTLNLDTPYNIFRIGISLRRVYENQEAVTWMLVPEEHIVQQYHQAIHADGNVFRTERGLFPNIDNGVFKYRFKPIDKVFQQTLINRQDTLPTGVQLSHEHVHTYFWPYENFPLVKSHLHPKFVILEAGRKLRKLSSREADTITAQDPVLLKISQIYSAWTQPCPDPSFIGVWASSGDAGDEDLDGSTLNG